MEQLIKFGRVSRGLLGVSIGTSDVRDVAETYGLSDNSGALVAGVTPDSAAERAGIQINDVIVSMNDHRDSRPGLAKGAIGLLATRRRSARGTDSRRTASRPSRPCSAKRPGTPRLPPSQSRTTSVELDPASKAPMIVDNYAGVAPACS